MADVILVDRLFSGDDACLTFTDCDERNALVAAFDGQAGLRSKVSLTGTTQLLSRPLA